MKKTVILIVMSAAPLYVTKWCPGTVPESAVRIT